MKGHIRQRSKNSWTVIVDMGKKMDGSRNQKSIAVPGGKRKAQQELNRILSELDKGVYVEPSKQSLDKYLNDWLLSVASTLALKTFSRYDEIIKRHIIPALGKIELQKLNGMHLESYYNLARISGRIDGKGGLSEQTLLHHHRVLARAMKRAERLKLRSGNPCLDIDAPKAVRHEIVPLNETQTIELLNAAANTRLYIPILVTVTTGLRLGELLALRWIDVDLDAPELAGNRTLQRISGHGLVVKDSPKTRSSRRKVALGSVTVEAFRNHLIGQNNERLLLGALWNDNGLVFPSDDGSYWGPDAVSHQFSNLAKKNGFALTFHGLRHTHATHLLRAGVDFKVASDRLGHSNIAITLDLYSHVLEDSRQEAANIIDGVFKKAFDEVEK
jgi:integrase